ncbi:hypothetical protein F5Y15DRAFT_159448 [Xylariaceae sp. FL0016]|nr:hypothetical protein F5Y15DRAFT_159448 [Xylariaceae sp. FL0016]
MSTLSTTSLTSTNPPEATVTTTLEASASATEWTGWSGPHWGWDNSGYPWSTYMVPSTTITSIVASSTQGAMASNSLTDSQSTDAKNESNSVGLSLVASAGLGIGIALFLISIAGFAYFYLHRRRRRERRRDPEKVDVRSDLQDAPPSALVSSIPYATAGWGPTELPGGWETPEVCGDTMREPIARAEVTGTEVRRWDETGEKYAGSGRAILVENGTRSAADVGGRDIGTGARELEG